MIKIGVLYGMEESFPPALVDRINAKRRQRRGGRTPEDRRRRDGGRPPATASSSTASRTTFPSTART